MIVAERYKIRCAMCRKWFDSPGPHAPANWGLFCRVEADGAASKGCVPFCSPCADSLWSEEGEEDDDQYENGNQYEDRYENPFR